MRLKTSITFFPTSWASLRTKYLNNKAYKGKLKVSGASYRTDKTNKAKNGSKKSVHSDKKVTN